MGRTYEPSGALVDGSAFDAAGVLALADANEHDDGARVLHAAPAETTLSPCPAAARRIVCIRHRRKDECKLYARAYIWNLLDINLDFCEICTLVGVALAGSFWGSFFDGVSGMFSMLRQLQKLRRSDHRHAKPFFSRA